MKNFLLLLIAALSIGPALAQAPPAEQHMHGTGAVQAQPAGANPAVIDVPPVDIGAQTLDARAAAERSDAAKLKVPYDFRFTDRLPESGITFVHQIVDDAGKTYKAAHYDHGNGIAAADVDGDGKIDLYFVNQLGGSELWRNVGGGKLENITASAGVAVAGRIGVTASFADIDNDGDQDLFVTTVRGGNVLFENDGKGHFKDISKQAGVDYSGHSSGAVFLDYDRDGRVDLFVCNVGKYTTEQKGRGGYYIAYEDAFSGHLKPERTEYSILYHNEGPKEGEIRFKDVSEAMGLRDGGWSGDASLVDFNDDGYPDLYVLNMQGDNHYWENKGGKAFVDRTAEVFPKTSWGAMGIKSFDDDNDGNLDLFITDMHSDMVKDMEPQDERIKLIFKGAEKFFHEPENNIFGNSFFRNQGDGTFREISDQLGVENYWPWGVSVGDLNADGFEDVLIEASMNFPYRYGVNSLLLNNQGQGFVSVEMVLGIEPRRNGRTRKTWFTLDCSGADKAHKLCNGRTGTVTVTGTLGTRSAVILDLDGDGDLDIVTNEFNAEPQVFISDLAQKHKPHWLGVRLIGKTTNRDGLGAKVTVMSGTQKMTQRMDGASGYLSHSVMPLYFGLGEAESATRVEVLWPTGRKQVVKGPVGGKVLEIVEEAGK
jgi:hypothetical protein